MTAIDEVAELDQMYLMTDEPAPDWPVRACTEFSEAVIAEIEASQQAYVEAHARLWRSILLMFGVGCLVALMLA